MDTSLTDEFFGSAGYLAIWQNESK